MAIFWGNIYFTVDKNSCLTDSLQLAHLNKSIDSKSTALHEVVAAHLRRITNWPDIQEKNCLGFEKYADALQAAVFTLDQQDCEHELRGMPLCAQLVRKLEREKIPDTIDGLAKWAQARANMMRKRDLYYEQQDFEKCTFRKDEEKPKFGFFSK